MGEPRPLSQPVAPADLNGDERASAREGLESTPLKEASAAASQFAAACVGDSKVQALDGNAAREAAQRQTGAETAAASPRALREALQSTVSCLIVTDVQRDFCEGGSLGGDGRTEMVHNINRLRCWRSPGTGHALSGVPFEQLPSSLKASDIGDELFNYVVVSRDWHPPNHLSFAKNHGSDCNREACVCGDDTEAAGEAGPSGRHDGGQKGSPDATEHFAAAREKSKTALASLEPNQIRRRRTGIVLDLWPVHCVQGTPGAELHEELLTLPSDITLFKATNREVENYSCFGDGQDRTQLASWLQEWKVETVCVVGLCTDYCVSATAIAAVKVPGVRTVCVLLDCSKSVVEEATPSVCEVMRSKGIHVMTAKEMLG
ncbi:Nicotinamidase [Besnoitia besnoiti]|uniref:nicotinamidase n=1 Tax=Besnoitia besnoiti TaxID=94643 RepID=A0A2A9M1Y5_BESBE|nr:Nicotinamidase [Besnoitia besnoiti]PFH31254.1 Nicotinamidase [Besnoitia besnoiti]